MHPYDTYVLVALRRADAERHADAARLVAMARLARATAVKAEPALPLRQRLGFTLVEAGLHLAVGKSVHPPKRRGAAAESSAVAR